MGMLGMVIKKYVNAGERGLHKSCAAGHGDMLSKPHDKFGHLSSKGSK
jgi:hypothetical protein